MQKVAVVNCILIIAVDFQEVVPDVLAEGALVLGQHERRLRNKLEVNFDFVHEDFMICDGVVVGAILRLLRT
jgi:hypothetical protein